MNTRRSLLFIVLLAVAAFAAFAAHANAKDVEILEDSGFAWIAGDDEITATVDRDSVKKGVPKEGHPIDAIPAIDEPAFYDSYAAAEEELGLAASDRVLGVVVGDDARAYPTRILDRHEIANDTIGGKHLAVVW